MKTSVNIMNLILMLKKGCNIENFYLKEKYETFKYLCLKPERVLDLLGWTRESRIQINPGPTLDRRQFLSDSE
jgi:hypothetical protein